MNELLKNIINDIKRYTKAKKVVYTAIFGNYDQLKEPEIVDDDVEYYCFTDNVQLESNRWNIVYVDSIYRNKVRTAKIFKLFPHLIFPNSFQSIWVDGCYSIQKSLTELFNKVCNHGLMFYPHIRYNCIYKEACVLKLNKTDNPSIINSQISEIKKNGYPKNNGLIHGAVIVRNHSDQNVKKCMSDWWDEIERFSYRDQLSFNYVAWRNCLSVKYADHDLNNTELFKWSPHYYSTKNTFRTILLKILFFYFSLGKKFNI